MDWVRDLFAVMFVMGLLVLLVWLSRFRTASGGARLPFRFKSFRVKSSVNQAGRLALLDRLAVSPTNSLLLVRADTRTFLLAVHSAGVAVLSELITPEEKAK